MERGIYQRLLSVETHPENGEGHVVSITVDTEPENQAGVVTVGLTESELVTLIPWLQEASAELAGEKARNK